MQQESLKLKLILPLQTLVDLGIQTFLDLRPFIEFVIITNV